MKKVLIIGAGFLQRFVIRKAKQLGYYTLAVDGNPNAVGFTDADEYAVINIVDQKACLEYARKHRIDGVLTAATDYGVLSASFVAEQMGLPGVSYEAAQRVKNKYVVRNCLCEAGADDTGMAYLVAENTDIQKLSNALKFPVMVKPCDGSGSRGAAKVESKHELFQACQNAMTESLSHTATIEPFIIGKEYGVESFVENGNIHVLGIMQKWMTQPPYYAELGHAIPSDLAKETEEKIAECVTNAIRALGINFGSVNMDLLLTAYGEVHIVDIGARMGGNLIGSHVIPLGTGIDYMANMIHAAVGDPFDFAPKQPGVAVATRILAFAPGVVNKLPEDVLQPADNVHIYHHIQVGQRVNTYHTNLDGCGYIVAHDEEICVATGKAEETLLSIKKEIF